MDKCEIRTRCFLTVTMACRWVLLLILGFGMRVNVNEVRGQGTQADYARMKRMGSISRNKVFRTDVKPNWIHNETGLWYRIQTGPGESEFVVIDIRKGNRSLAFNHTLVADQLGKILKKNVSAEKLPISELSFDPGMASVFFKSGSKFFRVSRSDSQLMEVKAIPAYVKNASATIQKSGPSRVKISITIKNERDSSVRLYWVDQDGNEKDYGVIQKRSAIRMQTYVGHSWMITDAKKNPLAAIRAAVNEEIFAVTKDSKLNSSIPKRKRRPRSVGARKAPVSIYSPDREWRVMVRDYNLFLKREKGNQEEIRLTSDGTEKDYYTAVSYWAPDSKRFFAMREQPGEKRTVYMVESSPRDRLQPRLHSMSYAKPGDRMRKRRPCLFHVATRKQIPVKNDFFETPWSLTDFRWTADGSELQFLYNQRGHQVLRIVGINSNNGAARIVVEEKSPTFIDYSRKFKKYYLGNTEQVIWSSERDGWNHLYRFDLKQGKLINQVTRGNWVVRRIDRVDEEKQQIWFQAGGIIPSHDPYYVHFCRVDFSGENLTVLTQGDGTHSIQYSPSGRYFMDSYSKVDMPTVTELRNTETGKLNCILEKGDDRLLLETGWRRPERFVAEGRDGRTPIFGVIYRPSNFDPGKKYPVIEYIYAGPHGSFVPKSYATYRRVQAMTELGFVVVQIDGMGTSNRSKAFHDVCWKNLGDSGFPDRILWLKAAARKYPSLDLKRVGIFGGSAGGQSALRALLAHGEFYKAAVSDCGCHDNRMDKIWWNEQWMGWPIGPHYEQQSNVTNAHKLKGKLLLIVGELDRNVDPASTLQVVNALIKADRDFEFLLVPGGGHGIGSGSYGQRRTHDFFVRHLLNVEPRKK